jgi:hypothetical protein
MNPGLAGTLPTFLGSLPQLGRFPVHHLILQERPKTPTLPNKLLCHHSTRELIGHRQRLDRPAADGTWAIGWSYE